MAAETAEATKTAAPEGPKKCSQEGCKRPYRAKGYCNVHYRKWRHGELPKTRYKICTKEGCRKPRAGEHGSVCAEHGKGEETAAA